MGFLDSLFVDKTIISVQNGVRMELYGFLSNSGNITIPNYFSFGKYEEDVVKKYKIKSKSIYNSGSLRSSLFLLSGNYKFRKTNSDICFISQYWPIDSTPHRIHCRKMIRKLFSSLVYWNNNSNKRVIKVAIRNRVGEKNYNDEYNFYKRKNVKTIKRTTFSSYEYGFKSEIIVTMFSTIGFELFGLGKKVLFCGKITDSKYEERKSVDFALNKIPDFMQLYSLSPSEIDRKLNILINMSEKEYLMRTRYARKYYMSSKRPQAHTIINDYISSIYTAK